MYTFSYLALIIGGLVLFGCGWLVNRLISGKSTGWKQKHDELEKSIRDIEKKLKKEEKTTDQFRAKSESWKHEYHALTQEHQRDATQHKDMKAQLEQQIYSLNEQFSKVQKDKVALENTLEKLQTEHERLKEKYKNDLAVGKDWRSAKMKMERELKSTQDRLEKTTIVSNDYKAKYEKQAEAINQIRVMERELRMLKTKNKKFEADIAYWEKKHYDTHHELAQMKIESESISARYKELEALRKGDELLKSNLMGQIQEFKTKFVNINNKYRESVKADN